MLVRLTLCTLPPRTPPCPPPAGAYTHANLAPDWPVAPVKGSLSFKVQALSLTITANVTRVFITLNPAFHVSPVIKGGCGMRRL